MEYQSGGQVNITETSDNDPFLLNTTIDSKMQNCDKSLMKNPRRLSNAKTVKKIKFVEMKQLPSSQYKEMWDSFSNNDRRYIDQKSADTVR